MWDLKSALWCWGLPQRISTRPSMLGSWRWSPRSPPSSSSSPSSIPSSRAVLGSVTTNPQGHCVNTPHQDCGYGGVYTHIHDPVKGTFYPSPRPLENPKSIDHASLGSGHTLSSQGTMGLGAKQLLGKLPKMNFPKFEGENPRLRQSCCELF
jgi:hypothetical protein